MCSVLLPGDNSIFVVYTLCERWLQNLSNISLLLSYRLFDFFLFCLFWTFQWRIRFAYTLERLIWDFSCLSVLIYGVVRLVGNVTSNRKTRTPGSIPGGNLGTEFFPTEPSEVLFFSSTGMKTFCLRRVSRNRDHYTRKATCMLVLVWRSGNALAQESERPAFDSRPALAKVFFSGWQMVKLMVSRSWEENLVLIQRESNPGSLRQKSKG